jgi:hypothetical protein
MTILTDQMVEAAAAGLFKVRYAVESKFDQQPEDIKESFRFAARAALTAILPDVIEIDNIEEVHARGRLAGLTEARNILAESKDRAIAFDSIGRAIRSLSPPTTKEREDGTP